MEAVFKKCNLDSKALSNTSLKLNHKKILNKLAQPHGFETIENNLCTFCKKDPETFMLLLCECKIGILFWNSFNDWISSKLCINIVYDKQHILFCFKNKNRSFDLINGLLLCARFLGLSIPYQNPICHNFFDLINFVKKSKFLIAEQNYKLSLHFKKLELF